MEEDIPPRTSVPDQPLAVKQRNKARLCSTIAIYPLPAVPEYIILADVPLRTIVREYKLPVEPPKPYPNTGTPLDLNFFKLHPFFHGGPPSFHLDMKTSRWRLL